MNRIACPTAMIVLTSLGSTHCLFHLRTGFPWTHLPTMLPSGLSLCPSIHSPLLQAAKSTLHSQTAYRGTCLKKANILHVAYAVNADNSWLSAAWTDNTGTIATSILLPQQHGRRIILTEFATRTLSLCRNIPHRIFVRPRRRNARLGKTCLARKTW